MERVADDPATSSAKSASVSAAVSAGISSARSLRAGTSLTRRDDGVVGLRVREVLGRRAWPRRGCSPARSGLDRIVQRLNVMEVPDILPWVKPHELLLTTGYPLRDDPTRWSTWSASSTTAAWPRSRSSCTATSTSCRRAARRGRPPRLPGHRVPPARSASTTCSTRCSSRCSTGRPRRRPQRGGAPGAGLGGARRRRPQRPRRRAGRDPRRAGPGDHAGRPGRGPGGRRRRARPDLRVTGVRPVGTVPGRGRARRHSRRPRGSRTVVPIVAGRVDHGRIVTFSRRPSPRPTCTAWSGPRPWPRSP